MFIFAIYGIQTIGGQLARCNDRGYYDDKVIYARENIFKTLNMNNYLGQMSWNILERALRV